MSEVGAVDAGSESEAVGSSASASVERRAITTTATAARQNFSEYTSEIRQRQLTVGCGGTVPVNGTHPPTCELHALWKSTEGDEQELHVAASEVQAGAVPLSGEVTELPSSPGVASTDPSSTGVTPVSVVVPRPVPPASRLDVRTVVESSPQPTVDPASTRATRVPNRRPNRFVFITEPHRRCNGRRQLGRPQRNHHRSCTECT
jgi:hypothetical protein